MEKSTWIPITELEKIDPDSVDWEKLEKAMKELEDKGCEPHIKIWVDEIGTEFQFEDGSFSCRDFGGNDRKYFMWLMVNISEHNWRRAIKLIEEYFING